jgi:GNAT superfamily N-acetyltransferase
MAAPELLVSDLELARRLERAEASNGADFVEARARLRPESGARWIEVAGANAMYDGPKSPVTQTFGLGLFDAVASEHLDELEAFFRERGAPVHHEVSPIAGLPVIDLLVDRGYRPCELTSVLYRRIGRELGLAARNPSIAVRRIGLDEVELWADTAARGWQGEYEALSGPEFVDSMRAIAELNLRRSGGHAFLAVLDGRAVAAGALGTCGGIAHLGGATTVPEARRQGAQLALLEARLRYAAELGCEIALMGAAPGSGSQRNAERQGFRIAYTRIKWRLA